MPRQWCLSRLTCWKRKGKPTDLTMYWGLSVGPVLTIVCLSVVLRRISEWYDNSLL